jgi:hypothetical protein
MICHCARDVVEIQSKFFRLNDELFQFRPQEMTPLRGGGCGWLGDDGADAWTDFQHPFGHQLRDYFVRCVGINFQILTERTDGRERIAWAHLPGNHGLFGSIDDLLIDRDAGLKSQAKRYHVCTITGSTVVDKRKMQEDVETGLDLRATIGIC